MEKSCLGVGQMFKKLFGIIIIISSFTAIAQEALSEFGNLDQPGNIVHRQITAAIANGQSKDSAIESLISLTTGQEFTEIDGETKSTIVFDTELSERFFDLMVDLNSLIEVTKILSEEYPDKAVLVITLATKLYPGFAQEVFDGAALAGVLPNDEILVAVLEAGADPSTVSDATAAGPAADGAIAVVPLGVGVGAGGTGGGDTTASTN